jgi:hypothetical protein
MLLEKWGAGGRSPPTRLERKKTPSEFDEDQQQQTDGQEEQHDIARLIPKIIPFRKSPPTLNAPETFHRDLAMYADHAIMLDAH